MRQRCKQWRRQGRRQWEPSWFCRSHCFCCSHRMLTIITCDNSKFLWWCSPITIQIWWSTTSLHVGMIIKGDDSKNFNVMLVWLEYTVLTDICDFWHSHSPINNLNKMMMMMMMMMMMGVVVTMTMTMMMTMDLIWWLRQWLGSVTRCRLGKNLVAIIIIMVMSFKSFWWWRRCWFIYNRSCLSVCLSVTFLLISFSPFSRHFGSKNMRKSV